MSLEWYAQNTEFVVHELNTDLEQGLSAAEVASRLQQYGYNHIQPTERPSWLRILLFQLTSVSVLLALVAAIVFLLLFDSPATALLIAAIILAHVLMRHWQYARVERVRTVLAGYPHYRARVLRNGNLLEIDAREIVPGDVIHLHQGDRVPADARLVDAIHLTLDESFITGMTEPVPKQSTLLSTRELLLSEQKNMVFAGTFALRGEGRAVVVATGQSTELSGTYRLLGVEENPGTESLFHLSYLERFGIALGVAFGAIVAVIAWFTEGAPSFQEAFSLGMSFAVAAVPGGLVALAASILASNTYQILQMGAVVRHLGDLETLASVTAICAEHVGGFTQADMQVKQILVDGQIIPSDQFDDCFELLSRDDIDEIEEDESARVPVDLPLLMIVATQSADTLHAEKLAAPFDYATDQAITEAAATIGVSKSEYRSLLTRIREVPAGDKTWRRQLFRNTRDHLFLFVMGSVDVVLEHSLYMQRDGRAMTLRDEHRHALLIKSHEFTTGHSRVFAIAYRRILPEGDEQIPETIQDDKLTFLGMLALNDPTYEDAPEALQAAQDTGLKLLLMIDEASDAATKVSQEIGLLRNHVELVTGEEFAGLDRQQRAERLSHTLVCSEFSPEQRAEVVDFLQQHDYSVAIMGNRPEHVHSLKMADVAVCTANRASDIALEVSTLVLHEQGFSRLLSILVQTRQTWVSIRNSMRWLLSCHVGMTLTLAIAFVLHIFYERQFAIPISLVQMLWISFAVTVVPTIALEGDTLAVPINYTRARRSGQLLGVGYKLDIFLRGLVIALMALVSYVFTIQLYDGAADVLSRGRTVTMNVLILTQLLFIYQCHRRFVEPMGHRLLSNRKLLIAIAVVLLIQLCLIYLPVVNTALGLVALGWQEWLFTLGFCVIALLPLDMLSRRH